jgi:hypothetical protein
MQNRNKLEIKFYDSRKLKFAIFENFTNNCESIRDISEGSRE